MRRTFNSLWVVPAGSTITLRVNFDYATTSIAHFAIIGRYSLLAMSQAGKHCWPIQYEQTAFAFKKLEHVSAGLNRGIPLKL